MIVDYADLMIVDYDVELNSHDPQWTWLFNDLLWRGPMSPQHEEMFTLLCVLSRVATTARHQSPDKLLVLLGRLHERVFTTLLVFHNAKVSLRVRTALEAIEARTSAGIVAHDPYQAMAFVFSAAAWGTGKSKLLRAVTDQTWREQCAGRATAAMRRDFPELAID